MSLESDSASHHPASQPIPTAPAEAELEGGSQIHELIQKQAIIETEHQRCCVVDYFFIQDIQNQLGLPEKEVNQDNMSGFLHGINVKRQETWNEADWHKFYIWSAEGTLAMLQQTIKKPDKDMLPILLANLQSAITQLEECQHHHMMAVAGDLKGTVDLPFIKYVARVFVNNKGNPLNTLTGETSSKIMLGLLQLHIKDAICHHQKSNIDTKTTCQFCPLSIRNHESANNHIQAHWCLGLICGKCFQVKLTCKGIVAHAKEARHFDLK